MKRKIYHISFMVALFAVLVFSSCASKKKAASGSVSSEIVGKTDRHKQNADLFKRVNANALTSDALTSKMKFTVQTADKSISVAGQLEMKNDKYIRIRLTPLGLFEVAMIEFTTDYVLVLDRMHKEYIKASYAQVPFLEANGVDFYALQSLFRNRLFIPGEHHLESSSYKKFDVGSANGKTILSVNKGKMKYHWFVNTETGRINNTEFTYISGNNKSALKCLYSDFDNVSGKMFPHTLSLNFVTNAANDFKNLSLTVSAKKFKAEQKGDGMVTSIPRKYMQRDVTEMLKKILEVK